MGVSGDPGLGPMIGKGCIGILIIGVLLLVLATCKAMS